MVQDMRVRIRSVDANTSNEPHQSNQMGKWSICVEEIEFHIEIIEYLSISHDFQMNFIPSLKKKQIFALFDTFPSLFQSSRSILQNDGVDFILHNIRLHYMHYIQFVCN